MHAEEIRDASRQEGAKTNGACLYACESIVDAYEYKKMAKYFPRRMYWAFVRWGTYINTILAASIAIVSKSWIATACVFISFQVVVLILYKVRLERLSEKIYNARLERGIIDVRVETEFYDDHFIRKGEKVSIRFDYPEISRCVETDANFYLEHPGRNMVLILQKSRCGSELTGFIRGKFGNVERMPGNGSSYAGVENPKLVNTLMTALFIATLCCLGGALGSVSMLNEAHPQPGLGFVENTWVSWCWLPIPLASTIAGFVFEGKGRTCTKNIVAGLVIGYLLLAYGAFSLIYARGGMS